MAEQEGGIAKQNALIERLRKRRGGVPLDDALRRLAEMQDLLKQMREHAARL